MLWVSAAGAQTTHWLGPQWTSYNNHLDGERFSPLKQIKPDNVAQLVEVCRAQVDGPTSFSAGLIVVDGVLYTNTGRETVALDAATCATRWRHSYAPEDDEIRQSSRGPAVLDGRLFRGTGDGALLALDTASGKLLWKALVATPRLGELSSAAPLAWQGIVYMGVGGGGAGARGRVVALEAATGRELWRFNTIPLGKEPGASTWKRALSAKTGGGGVWGAMTLDITTGELFVPVGNPWPDFSPDFRPGENLFANSIVVLDARTGALHSWYKAVAVDARDLDLAAPPALYRDSKIRDVVAFAGKDGHLIGVDRDTGKVLYRTAITTMENESAWPTPQGVHVCPGTGGGVEWNGPAFDPGLKMLFVGAVDWCMTFFSAPAFYAPPESNQGGYAKPDEQAHGWVIAVDSETGEVRWRYRTDMPVIAGVTPTAGGVTFTGDTGGNFLALDSKTGALLLKHPTGGAMAGGVVTYEIGGKQFVAFASGNVSRATFGALGLPSVVVMALNGVPLRDEHGAPQPASAGEASGGAVVPAVQRGGNVYKQICASCHGPKGDLVSGHDLGSARVRGDLAAIVATVKSPRPPMPKMFPEVLTEQNVADVAAYVQQELGR